MTGFYKYGNESLGSMKYLEVLQWLSEWRLLKKDSAPWRKFLYCTVLIYEGRVIVPYALISLLCQLYTASVALALCEPRP
jgi:hypothetical protein